MKVLVREIENEGLESLLGKKVTLLCSNYFYTGILVGVNETCAKLEKPEIIYETGAFSDSKYKDAQSLCTDFFYVQKSFIESFGVLK